MKTFRELILLGLVRIGINLSRKRQITINSQWVFMVDMISRKDLLMVNCLKQTLCEFHHESILPMNMESCLP